MFEAKLVGRGVQLVPLGAEHLPGLRTLELSSELAFRWRHSGQHLSPAEYADAAWHDVLCAFLVFDGAAERGPRGIVTAYQADHVNGHCRVAAARFGPADTPAFAVVRGMTLLFEYLFKGWPFRKLYLEVPEYNLSQIASITEDLCPEEGRLASYCYLDGRYWDWIFLSVSRERWIEGRAPYLGFVRDGSSEQPA
jgi:hypothetical protein